MSLGFTIHHPPTETSTISQNFMGIGIQRRMGLMLFAWLQINEDCLIKHIQDHLTYINISLCFKFILFVFQIKRMKPFIKRIVQTKCDVSALPDG